MSRQSVIRVKAEFIVAYDRKKFGDAAAAEKHHDTIKAAFMDTLGRPSGKDATLTKWEPEHTTVEVDETPAAKR